MVSGLGEVHSKCIVNCFKVPLCAHQSHRLKHLERALSLVFGKAKFEETGEARSRPDRHRATVVVIFYRVIISMIRIVFISIVILINLAIPITLPVRHRTNSP